MEDNKNADYFVWETTSCRVALDKREGDERKVAFVLRI
jgi:hypothetical protein